MTVDEQGAVVDRLIDPDPFTIGLGLFGAVAGGGAFLEARRQRQTLDKQHLDACRAAWYECRRTVIFFKRSVDEFETYILEENFGRKEFKIGSVRLMVVQQRHKQLRRLKGQVFTTANIIADNIDDLSEFLGPESQSAVDRVLTAIQGLSIPERYIDVIRTSRAAIDAYSDLLDAVGDELGFQSSDDS